MKKLWLLLCLGACGKPGLVRVGNGLVTYSSKELGYAVDYPADSFSLKETSSGATEIRLKEPTNDQSAVLKIESLGEAQTSAGLLDKARNDARSDALQTLNLGQVTGLGQVIRDGEAFSAFYYVQTRLQKVLKLDAFAYGRAQVEALEALIQTFRLN